MPVYHIVLFKLKEGVTAAQKEEVATEAKAMVGQIPGLIKLDVGPPLPVTAHRGHGFNMGIVAVLETADDVPKYAAHPAHTKVHALREALCDDTLAFDLEY